MSTFIELKLNYQDIYKIKNIIENKNNEIEDVLTLVSNDNEIKIAEFDKKLITEKESLYYEFRKKMDNISDFIESNIKKYRLELIRNIAKFEKDIKTLMLELNDKILIEYSEEYMQAIFYIEDKSVKIKKLIEKKDNFRLQEKNIELDVECDMSRLDDLEYEYQLKSK